MRHNKRPRGHLSMARANFHARGIHIPKNFRGYSGERVYTYEMSNGDLAFTARPKQKDSWVVPSGLTKAYRKIWKM